jgi:Na+/proline symporter
VVEGLPAGVSGLLLAGIIAAAMSTLSSTVNSLASSSLLDVYNRFSSSALDESRSLMVSRGLTFFWGGVLIGFASLFEDSNNAVVELGLTIASYTYGALLGVFLLAILIKRSDQTDALLAFALTIVAMIFIIFGVWHSPAEGWVVAVNPSAADILERGLKPIAWPWYPLIGATITLTVGALSSAVPSR